MDSLKIGNITLPHRAVFGPMAGFTDAPCRRLMAQHGAGFTVSEMVSSRALVYHDHKTVSLLKAEPNGAPYGVQIFGEVPQIMGEAAAAIEEYEFDFLDINMGCPAPKITGNGDGSALMRSPALAARIIEAAVRAVSIPVSVKFRLGWDADSINAVEFAKMAESSGAAFVTVHGRTRMQMYSGTADWDKIAEVVNAVRIPVIGNGDVFSGTDAAALAARTGCAGIMAARGAQGNPWIFREVKAALSGQPIPERPTEEEVIYMLLRHAQLSVQYKGEKMGIREMRKHTAWYTTGMHGSSTLRNKVNQVETFDALQELLMR